MYTLNQRAFKFILMTQERRKQRKARWAKMKLVYYAPRLDCLGQNLGGRQVPVPTRFLRPWSLMYVPMLFIPPY